MKHSTAVTGLTVVDRTPEARFQLAAAILVHNDCVLIVRRSMTERFLPGVWGVPCGKVDPGETPRSAVIRELHEETGLTGEVIDEVGKSEFFSTWHGKQILNRQSNFLMHPVGVSGPLKLPLPDQEARWVSAEEIDQFKGLDNYNRRVIRQWLQRMQSAIT